MKDKNCVFCKIIEGEILSFKIHENSEFLAILDIAQFVEGHTIVIPKEHHEFVWDMPNVRDYFEFVKSVSNHYRALGFTYVDSLTFGRMIKHAHVHLIPHNDDNEDWKKALSEIGRMQLDESRRMTFEKGKEIQQKFIVK